MDQELNFKFWAAAFYIGWQIPGDQKFSPRSDPDQSQPIERKRKRT